MGDTNTIGIDYAKGATFIGDTATYEGRWCAIHFTSNATVNAITAQNWNGSTLAGQSFDALCILYGVFTSIKLQNGHCVAYKL
jgi:hypothetical protein